MNTKETVPNKPFFTRVKDRVQQTKEKVGCRLLMDHIEGLAHTFFENFNVRSQWKINDAEVEIFEKWLAYYILFRTQYPDIGKPGFKTETLAIKRLKEEAEAVALHQEQVNYVIGIGQDGSGPFTVLDALKSTANSVAVIYNRYNQGEIDKGEFSRQSALLVRRANIKSKAK